MSEQKKENSNIGPFVLSALFLVIVVSLIFVPQNTSSTKTSSSILDGFSFSHSIFEELILEADVSYIAELETGNVVYQKNADVVRPLASLTKIMTTYAALQVFPENASITIVAADLVGAGDHGLVPGEIWKLKDLLTFMLVTSSNDAAIAVGRVGGQYVEGGDFVKYMNNLAKDMNLETLSFLNTSGLDVDEDKKLAGAFGSAEDLSILFALAYKTYPEVFDVTKEKNITIESNTEVHNIENTNTSLDVMSGIIGSKTGYTRTAGGNLSVVTQVNNIPHVVTVLQSTREGRFDDVNEIINIIKDNNHD